MLSWCVPFRGLRWLDASSTGRIAPSLPACRGRDVAPRWANSGGWQSGSAACPLLSLPHRPLAFSDDFDPAAPVGVCAVRLARLHRGGVSPHPPRAGGLRPMLRLSRDRRAQQTDPISLLRGLRVRASASADFLSWDFKVRPSVVRPCGQCPGAGVATDALRPTAAMLPAPPLLPF